MAYAAGGFGRTDSFQRVRPSYQVGEIITFGVIPAILTIYFITIAIGAQCGAEWVLNDPAHFLYGWLVSLCQTLYRSCGQYRFYAYQV